MYRRKRSKDAPARKPPEETICYLKEGELKRLMETAKARSKRDYAIFLLGLRHGLRSSEVCGLKVSSVDLDAKLIETGRLKGSIKCCQLMQPDELRAVNAWLKEKAAKYPHTEALFPSERTGKALTRSGLLQLMRKYGELCGLPADKWYFHVLKHTCATQLLEKKAPIVWIQEWLGHKEIRNTSIYARLTPKGFDEESERPFPWNCSRNPMVESEPRTKILAVSEDGLQIKAEQRSAVFGFLDRISTKCVTLQPTRSTLVAYSRSRVGYWGFGVNRSRLQRWLAKLQVKRDVSG